jgi:uncharacterized lipoprotein
VKRIIATVAAVLSIAALSACGKITEPYKDAPRGESNTSPADTLTFPDGFSNVSAKCDGTTRVYVVFHSDSPYGSVAVSPDHPMCAGAR